MSKRRSRPLIVVDTTAHPGGGAITYFRNLLPELADDGWEYVVLVQPGREALTDITAPNITYRPVRFPVGNPLTREVFRQTIVPVVLARLDADLLFSPADVTTLLTPCPSVLLVQNLFPYAARFGLTFDWSVRLRHAIQRQLTQRSIRRATETIYVSEFTRDTVTAALDRPEGEGVVVHHGVDATRFSDSASPVEPLTSVIEGDRPYLLTVATVNRHKNLEVLLRAFARLPCKHKLLVAGRHPDSSYFGELRDMTGMLGITDDVTFLGKVSRKALPALYANATICVSASKIESFGLTVLEAMASGTPVVAADATTTPEVCGDAAVLFDPDDPSALVAAIERVLRDDSLAQTLTERGSERVAAFRWEQTAARTKALITRVLEQS